MKFHVRGQFAGRIVDVQWEAGEIYGDSDVLAALLELASISSEAHFPVTSDLGLNVEPPLDDPLKLLQILACKTLMPPLLGQPQILENEGIVPDLPNGTVG